MNYRFFTLYIVLLLFFQQSNNLHAQTALCKPIITKYTSMDDCLTNLSFEDIDNGSSDFDTFNLSQFQFFGPDTFTVTLTVSKLTGGTSSCESTLYVVDNVKPILYVLNNVFLKLDTNSQLLLTAEMFDAGSYDNCSGISHFTFEPSIVTCQEVSPLQIEITVFDHSGNSDIAVVDANLSNAQNSGTHLTCNDIVTIKLAENESQKIYPNMVLEGGPYKCWDQYSLEISENNVVRPNDFVDNQDVHKDLVIRVTHIGTNNSCWSILKVVSIVCDSLVICDTKSRCDSIGNCATGHSLSDDVEWPCDVLLTNLPHAVFNNPTPEVLAEYTQQDLSDFMPLLYEGLVDCSSSVGIGYQDLVFNSGNGKNIQRNWSVVHWSSGANYSYQQQLVLNNPGPHVCQICDFLPWDSAITDCGNGHSLDDAIEWPADVLLNNTRFSPIDLTYEAGFDWQNIQPFLREECKATYKIQYTDDITFTSIDSVHVDRNWEIVNVFTGSIHVYTQKIKVSNPPQDMAKVCVRQRTGNVLHDVTLYQGNTIDLGPCVEFPIDPAYTTITPTKVSSDYLEGIDLGDLILMREQILGIKQLSITQVLSGDFNGVHGVTTLDAVLLTKLINGETVNLTNWPSPWKFLYNDFNLLANKQWRNYTALTPANVKYYGQHFIGYKLGDLNNSYVENGIQPIPVDITDVLVTSGEKYNVPVFASKDMTIKGFQFKILKTLSAKINNITSTLFPNVEWVEYNDYISVLAYDNDHFTLANIDKGDLVFTIEVEALKNDVLHSSLQFYDKNHNNFIGATNYEPIPFEFLYDNIITVGSKTISLDDLSIYPNPATESIVIKGLDGSTYSVDMLDMVGQTIQQQTVQQDESISIGHLLPGMYLLRIKSKNGTLKMVKFLKI
ncbi:MAG: T9SS type A sorting domain-containing protein [Saprospiraceae bacterium]